MTLNETQQALRQWTLLNFPNSVEHPSHPALGMAEELCEIAAAMGPVLRSGLKKEQGIRPESWDRAAVVDGVADLLIYILDFCNKMDIDLQDSLDLTLEKVLGRDWNAARKGEVVIE
jgi:NTP pyrophosphatase (non-canonical NTP hydrolase)